MSYQRFVYMLLEDPDERGKQAIVVRAAIAILILANVMAVILGSMKWVQVHFENVLYRFEILSVAVFTTEYALRLWAATVNPRYAHSFTGRLRFALTPFALLDLIAILPFFLPWCFSFDLRILRLLRMLRILRVFKLARYSTAVRSLGLAFRDKREEIIVVGFVLVLLLIVASSLMYYAENEAQPDRFSSIPAAMYWGMSTLTTVGYGDMCPVTVMGRIFSMMIAVLGTGLFALPAAIWGAAFLERVLKKAPVTICPHCGKKV